jgi:AbrB family looped-hinge helix DNA binding protein
MVRAKVTSKGQVTLPVVIRRRYRLEPGDEIAFRMEQSSLRILPLRKRRLTDFRGVFPVARPHPGKDATRREIGRMLAEELEQKLRRR